MIKKFLRQNALKSWQEFYVLQAANYAAAHLMHSKSELTHFATLHMLCGFKQKDMYELLLQRVITK